MKPCPAKVAVTEKCHFIFPIPVWQTKLRVESIHRETAVKPYPAMVAVTEKGRFILPISVWQIMKLCVERIHGEIINHAIVY